MKPKTLRDDAVINIFSRKLLQWWTLVFKIVGRTVPLLPLILQAALKPSKYCQFPQRGVGGKRRRRNTKLSPMENKRSGSS
jgi:hypothetical protein